MAYTKKEQPGIVFYWPFFDAIEGMTGEETKRMLLAMRQYAQTGEETDFTEQPTLKMAWCFIRSHIDRDCKKYEEIREKNAKNGKTGGKKSGETRRANAEKPSPFGLE